MRYTRLLSQSYVPSWASFLPVLIDPATARSWIVSDVGIGPDINLFGTTRSRFASLSGGLTVFPGVGANGEQDPWVTDGTAGGTHLLAALQPGGSHSYTVNLFAHVFGTAKGSFAGNFATLDSAHALFTAFDAADKFHLWTTDGTAAGTRIVSDVTPVSADGSNSAPIIALDDGRALFTAYGGRATLGLWVTDGTAAGTQLRPSH